MTVGKIYPVREYETLKGKWRMLDAVLRNEEQAVRSDGSVATVREFVAIRIHGDLIEKFQREVHEGAVIEAQVRLDCEERVSKTGNMYLQNEMTFSCPEWRVL